MKSSHLSVARVGGDVVAPHSNLVRRAERDASPNQVECPSAVFAHPDPPTKRGGTVIIVKTTSISGLVSPEMNLIIEAAAEKEKKALASGH